MAAQREAVRSPAVTRPAPAAVRKPPVAFVAKRPAEPIHPAQLISQRLGNHATQFLLTRGAGAALPEGRTGTPVASPFRGKGDERGASAAPASPTSKRGGEPTAGRQTQRPEAAEAGASASAPAAPAAKTAEKCEPGGEAGNPGAGVAAEPAGGAAKPAGGAASGKAAGPAVASAAVAGPSPRQAIAPAAAAVRQRAGAARKHPPAAAPVASAQAAAVVPATEQQRGAATATVATLDAAKTEKVQREQFKTKLKKAIDKATTPPPKTEGEAERVMKSGGTQTSGALRSDLSAEREAAAGPMKSAASTEAPASAQPVEAASTLTVQEAGPPPAPVSAAPVIPASLPPERLNYSADKAPADRLMAENKVTTEQLKKGKDPAFGPTLDTRASAEKHEASAEAKYRKQEGSIQGQAQASARLALAQGLGGIHGERAAQLGKVAGKQEATLAKDAQNRQRITAEITAIKDQTKTDVDEILNAMETEAVTIFENGLKEAEKAYDAAFEEAKGGIGTWLTTWGDDWKKHIESSLATARTAYMYQVDIAIERVADFIDGKVKEAKDRVAAGRKAVDQSVNALTGDLRRAGEEARDAVAGNFDTMTSDIDERQDGLINKLVEKYKESYERMSAREQELRDANKTLWERVYDATVGLVKQILAFKDMLLGMLGKAANVIEDIIADPIGFLGNLIAGVMQGLKNFMSKIGGHLKKGLMDWLFGALASAGLQLPESFDLKGIVSIVLQVLGLTYANFRARAVAIVGEPVVKALEEAAEVFKAIVTEGIPGLWRFIKEKVEDLKSMVLDAIFSFIKEKVIIAGVTWIIGLLNPASAFFKACKAIYDIVVFFINRGAQIISLVNAIIDSLAAIVKGNIGVAANFVEGALGKAIPVAIGFLASLLGLGDPSKPVQETIKKAQKPVNTAIDWVIHQAVKLVKAAGKFLKGMFRKKDGKKTKDTPQPAAEGADVKLSAPFEMQGYGHTIYTEIKGEKLTVQMASDQRMGLRVQITKAMSETDNKAALKRLQRVDEKLKAAEKKVTFLISDKTKDAEVLSEADKMTQDAANTLRGIGNEFGIPSLQVIAHKSNFVDATVTGYRIKKQYEAGIRSLFYPSGYKPDTRQWKRDYIRHHTDPTNTNNYLDIQGRSTPKADATIDHQPRVVEHWKSHGKLTTQSTRADWYSDHKSGHLTIIAGKYNSSDGAEARQAGLRYTPEGVGKNFLGFGED